MLAERYAEFPGVAAAMRYVDQVLDGSILACKWVKAACQRQADDLARESEADRLLEGGEAPTWRYRFDAARAERWLRALELMPHVKGKWAGTLVVLEPWQKLSIACVFGWVDRETGARRFRNVYEEVARKNAKTTKGAALLALMVAIDGEAGAEAYSAATTADQARISFAVAQQMSRMAPQFRHRFGVDVLAHSIVVPSSGSICRPLAAEAGSLDGLNPHFALIDELHAHKDRALYDVLDSAIGARLQPLLWAITTAGTNRAGICFERRQHLVQVLNTTLRAHDGLGYKIEGNALEDDTTWGIIYTLDAEDDPFDETVWSKANPNLGISVDLDDMRRMARLAKAMPSAVNNFLTKRLNIWVNADTAWMDMRRWDACADIDLRIDEFAGDTCYVGIDAAFRSDVFAARVVFRRNGVVYAFGKYWMPAEKVEAEGNEHFAGWAREGRIDVTPGAIVDIERVRAWLNETVSAYQVAAVGYDPAQLTQFASECIEEGIPMVELRPTTVNFSPAMKEMNDLVVSGAYRHDGDPVMTWMVGNVVCHRDAKDNIYPRKPSPEKKIDGVVAECAALNRMLLAEPAAAPGIVSLN